MIFDATMLLVVMMAQHAYAGELAAPPSSAPPDFHAPSASPPHSSPEVRRMDKELTPLSGTNDGSATNLEACIGECDSDAQCKPGLKCFQRTGFTPVPGCSGVGTKDWDYCYDPAGSIELAGGNNGGAKNLQACIGECDSDSQCASGLKCFQRDNGETIPGCTGAGAGKDWDYCYDPNWQPKECINDVAFCEFWADDGECDANPDYMLTYCRKACGVCEGICSDDHEDCEYWAGDGGCEKNPKFMRTTCQKACGVCSPDYPLCPADDQSAQVLSNGSYNPNCCGQPRTHCDHCGCGRAECCVMPDSIPSTCERDWDNCMADGECSQLMMRDLAAFPRSETYDTYASTRCLMDTLCYDLLTCTLVEDNESYGIPMECREEFTDCSRDFECLNSMSAVKYDISKLSCGSDHGKCDAIRQCYQRNDYERLTFETTKQTCHKSQVLKKHCSKGCDVDYCKRKCDLEPSCTHFGVSSTGVCKTFGSCDVVDETGNVWVTYAVVSPAGPYVLSRGKKLMDVEVSANFQLKFVVNPHGTVSGWSNILHLTNGDANIGYGDRIPGVWFHSDSTKLHVCVSCDGNANKCLNPSQSLPLNEHTEVLVKNVAGEFSVSIDGERVASTSCDAPFTPAQRAKVPLYLSDPWYSSSKAVVSFLKYSPLVEYYLAPDSTSCPVWERVTSRQECISAAIELGLDNQEYPDIEEYSGSNQRYPNCIWLDGRLQYFPQGTGTWTGSNGQYVCKKERTNSREQCALEGESCKCDGTVYYGRQFAERVHDRDTVEHESTFEDILDGNYVKHQSNGDVECTNAAMGRDPVPGEPKKCICESSSRRLEKEVRTLKRLVVQVDSE